MFPRRFFFVFCFVLFLFGGGGWLELCGDTVLFVFLHIVSKQPYYHSCFEKMRGMGRQGHPYLYIYGYRKNIP